MIDSRIIGQVEISLQQTPKECLSPLNYHQEKFDVFVRDADTHSVIQCDRLIKNKSDAIKRFKDLVDYHRSKLWLGYSDCYYYVNF